jgi:hypothetical protein
MKKIIAAAALILGFAPAFASAQIGVSAVGSASVGSAVQTNVGVNASVNPSGYPTGGARYMRMSSSTRMASSSAAREARMENRVGTVTTRGNTEITVRITSLNQLATRIQAIKNVSDTQKANVAAEVQTEIASLTSLQGKIDAEASSTTGLSSTSPLRQDVSSITAAYRIYALIIPQANILSAADRADTLVTSFTTVGIKLQTRISALQTAGKDVTALTASLSDLNAKVADAKVQAQTAVTAVATLTPDNGNATIAASNKTSLQAGQTAIKATIADFQAAEKDARSIIQAVESIHVSASASASSTTSTQ